MAAKETSDEISSLAGRMLAVDNPLENRTTIARMVTKLVEAGWNTNRSSAHAVNDLERVLREEIGDPFADLRSLAGSALSQDVTPGSSS